QTIPIGVSLVTYANINCNNTSAGGATLSAAITGVNVIGNLQVQTGILNNGGFAINLANNRSFSVSNDATFNLFSTSGMVTVLGTGTKTFGSNSIVDYAGSSQTVSNESYGGLMLSGSGTKTLPATPVTVNSLAFNNSNGVLLNSDLTINNLLTLTSGNISTGSSTLTISSSGTVSRTSGHIIGNLKKNSFTGNKTFEVGTANGYTPVNLVATGNGDFTVRSVGTSHPNASGTNILQMYWTLTNGGLTSADLTFNYLDADVVGDENQYELGRYNGSWAFLSPITLNTTANTVSINGINSFSDWTLGEPGALPVELSSFTASVISSTVKLSWQTATEINNYG
ncbi:MAG: hypothetical protein Q8M94_21960, partial [Ignavibacteria bacterium]|nr:hypothetical protein [Ignavibacteria bacterium]